jgi:hypothetical protein
MFNIQRGAGKKKGRIPGVEGTLPPLTLEGHHSHYWFIEPELLNELLEPPPPNDSLLVEAVLGNGDSIKQEIRREDIY